MSSLLVTSGYHVGRRFVLGERTRMGRAPDNEIVLPDNLVSRYHVEIERSGSAYVVSDLGSKNGIKVNDKRLTERRLRRGDKIKVGATTLVFEASQELKTARFTNTLVHLDPEQDETMRVMEKSEVASMEIEEATGLIMKLAKVFETASSELPDVLHKILHHLLELFGATSGSIIKRARNGEIIPLTAETKGEELHINREALQLALDDGKAVLTASFIAQELKEKPKKIARKAMVAPMFEREVAFGAIHLERPEGSDYSFKDIIFLQALARLVSGPIRQAMRIDQLRQGQTDAADLIIGNSSEVEFIRSQLDRIAPTDSTVLITGETGTGKELVARTLHRKSPRATGPFVAINCAAIPATLIESELFGYEKGAFTGAVTMKRGKVEMADGGTLFLDEIGELEISLQPKLLRFLEEQIFYRVGGTRPIQTDVRVIAATNRNLEDEVRESRFRQDLMYRLNVLTLSLPPLRQRREDVRVLAEHFAPQMAARLGKPFLGVDDEAWMLLETYRWPGNIRELLQSFERALILSDSGLLMPEHFQINPGASELNETTKSRRQMDTQAATEPNADGVPPSLSEVERRAIIRALEFAEGNKNRAAEILSIHRNTLRKKMVEYKIKM